MLTKRILAAPVQSMALGGGGATMETRPPITNCVVRTTRQS